MEGFEHSICERFDVLCEDSIASDIRQGVSKLVSREFGISVANLYTYQRKVEIRNMILTKLVEAGVSMM
jgi:hypothetical protein